MLSGRETSAADALMICLFENRQCSCQPMRVIQEVESIRAYSTAPKPRASSLVKTTQSFRKSSGGRDQRGGGVVLDCRYVLMVKEENVHRVVEEIRDFRSEHDGDEVLRY